MDERTDRQTYVQIPPVFYRTLSPFGAEAQKEQVEEKNQTPKGKRWSAVPLPCFDMSLIQP